MPGAIISKDHAHLIYKVCVFVAGGFLSLVTLWSYLVYTVGEGSLGEVHAVPVSALFRREPWTGAARVSRFGSVISAHPSATCCSLLFLCF